MKQHKLKGIHQQQKRGSKRLTVYMSPILLTFKQREKWEGSLFWDCVSLNGELFNGEASIYCAANDNLEDIEAKQKQEEENEQLLDALRTAIQTLTLKQKYIIDALLSGKTQKQIAAELNITQGAVSLTLHGSHGAGGVFKKLRKLISKMVQPAH